MEKIYKYRRSVLTIGLGFLVGGMIHWTIPYAEINMLSKAFILKWSISSLLIGAIGVSVIKKSPLSASLLTTLGFILAVMARVIYETILIESTSHNLWPFEVIIATVIIFPASLIGAVITHLLIRTLSDE